MRIRKAGKFLGCTADYRTAPPLPTPWDSAGAISAAADLLCDLNRSSWIDNSIHQSLSNHRREAKLDSVNEEQMSVFETSFEAKEDEIEKTEEKEQDNKGQGRKEQDNKVAVINCKKTDGKGWHCKRPAQNPHSLCTYHLTQLRSYRARFDDHVSGDHRKKSSVAVDYGGAGSNYYYYYSILGPWWGKRRGPVNESSEWNEDCGGKSGDNEAAVDGDNVEEEEEEEEEEEDADDGGSRSDVIYKKKKKRVIKRRGRKPVKARSLKSLL